MRRQSHIPLYLFFGKKKSARSRVLLSFRRRLSDYFLVSFEDDELKDIKWAADLQGLTVEEFVSQAANKLVKNIKEDARKRIYNPKSIKILK